MGVHAADCRDSAAVLRGSGCRSVLKAQEAARRGRQREAPLFGVRRRGPRLATSPCRRRRAGFETIVKPFLAENCYGCHGNKKHKKDLNFEAIESVASLTTDGDRWDDVVAEAPAPGHAAGRRAAAGRTPASGGGERGLRAELARIEKATPPDPGRITARRLNRTEYNNTIRDLLGVDTHPADDFPQDDAGYGFDNIARRAVAVAGADGEVRRRPANASRGWRSSARRR